MINFIMLKISNKNILTQVESLLQLDVRHKFSRSNNSFVYINWCSLK